MTAIDFPDDPDEGDLFQVGTRVWRWDGVAWGLVGAGSSSLFLADLADGDRIDTLEGGTTIAARAVTWAKIQAINTARFLGRVTGGSGDIEEITASQAKALLAIVPADVTMANTARVLGRTTAGSGAAEELTAAQTKALLAVTAGDLTFANTARILGRTSGGGGAGEELTAAQTKTLLAIVPADVTGFDAQVRTNRVDQMATPTGTVSMGGQFVSNVGTPFFGTDAANKSYVDAKHNRLDKASGNPIATVVNTNTLTQLVSVATPATLAGDELILRFAGDHLNTSGSNTTFTLNLVLGGTTIANVATVAQGSGGARGKWYLEVHVDVEAVGGSPALMTSGFLQVAPTGTAANWGTAQAHTGILRSTAINLAAASTFVINITPANTHSTIDWRLMSYVATRIRA